LKVRREMSRRQHDFGRRFDNGECVAPAQQSIAGIATRLSALADEHIEELAENLHRDEGRLLRYPPNDGQSWAAFQGGTEGLRAL